MTATTRRLSAKLFAEGLRVSVEKRRFTLEADKN
jgi:hypothetical protein